MGSQFDRDLKVFMDGIIYQKQSYGGISRVYNEILPRMCWLDERLQITLFTDGPLYQPLPQHDRIRLRSAPSVKRPPPQSMFWKSLLAPLRRQVGKAWNSARSLWLGTGQGMIWHSTYYTLPNRWQGFQVVIFYDMIQERYPEIYNRQEDEDTRLQKQRCFEAADAVICNSETTRRELARYYGERAKPVYIVPLACAETFRKLEPSELKPVMPGDQPYLLYLGGRQRHKNFGRLVQAYSSWEKHGQVRLVVVGRPFTAEEKSYLETLGISEQVILLTDVSDNVLCQLYNQAAAFVYPSLYEGFGIPLLEAMACGCPLVASRIPSTLEVAVDFPFYFDPFDLSSLVAAMDRALESGHTSERMRQGFELVQGYSWERTARQTLDVYCSLVQTRIIKQSPGRGQDG